MALYYTYFVRGQSRDVVRTLPSDVEEIIHTVLDDFRSVGEGEWVGSSELAELPLQHEFRSALDAASNSDLVWLSPVDLGRDQRWATEELAGRLDRVRAAEGLETGSS